MRNKARKILYESFDRDLSDEENALLNHALAASPELLKEKREIQAIRENAAKAGESAFSPFFVEKTLGRLYSITPSPGTPGLFENLVAAFKPVAIGSAVAFIILIFFNSKDGTTVMPKETGAGAETSLEEMFEGLSWQMMEEAI
jgi:hypothetical protein